jgi:hypothetical protein
MQYCKNKPTSDAARAEHDSFFRQRQSMLGQKLNIEDLLIAPVQRFTKYQLLLQDLLKDTQKAKEDTSAIEVCNKDSNYGIILNLGAGSLAAHEAYSERNQQHHVYESHTWCS